MRIDQESDFDCTDLTFDEIDSGFTIKEAIEEAKRCLNCSKPLCRTCCPIENEIPLFISALAQGNIGEANQIIARRSNLPAICGRVCPHEIQCEAACVLAKKGCGVRIGKLERFIADFNAEMNINIVRSTASDKGRIAVIGSGPAGLTVAGDLAKMEFAVTVFEAQAEPGGVLTYGIPEFRLNKEVVKREIQRIRNLGVKFQTSTLIGPDITVDDLFSQGFDAVFIGTGTALPKMLNIQGKELPGVIQATYFLSMVKLACAGDLAKQEIPVCQGENVIVIGAGNVAMDAARTARRIGAGQVKVVYHKTLREITALRSEYEHAVAEGISFEWLCNTVAFTGKDRVEGLLYEKMEYDINGHVTATGETKLLQANKIILAVGQRPAARIISTTTGIDVDSSGYVITKERPYGMSSRRGVFAGGDVVHQPATVVLAMKEAKKIATGIAVYVEAKKMMEHCGLLNV